MAIPPCGAPPGGPGAVAVACDSLGLADAMLAATVSYAKVRTQFGRPIGSFQAVKHACADMLVRFLRRAPTRHRRRRGADIHRRCQRRQRGGVDGEVLRDRAAAVDVAGKAMQLHGGIGYTWESGIHVYLKRALLNRSLFGSPADHRRQLAQRYV